VSSGHQQCSEDRIEMRDFRSMTCRCLSTKHISPGCRLVYSALCSGQVFLGKMSLWMAAMMLSVRSCVRCCCILFDISGCNITSSAQYLCCRLWPSIHVMPCQFSHKRLSLDLINFLYTLCGVVSVCMCMEGRSCLMGFLTVSCGFLPYLPWCS